MRKLIAICAVLTILAISGAAQATTTVQGFESDTGDWGGAITRVSSPLTPAGGNYYAIVQADAYTYFDQLQPSPVWTGPYTQSIAVYIDTAAGAIGDKWNFTMAINRASDGTYLDESGIGAGKAADGWYVVCTGNAGEYGGGGTKIATSGWYTIGVDWTAGDSFLTRHAFVEPLNGAEIYSFDNTKTYQGLALDPAHQPGGTRYGWFSQLTMSGGLAVDNATLTVVPEPATMCLLGLGSLSLIRRKRNA